MFKLFNMKKKLLLIICLLGALGWGKASNIINNDGISILAADSYGDDRSFSIVASIDGHTLTVAFTEYLGDVTIEVNDITGTPVDLTLVGTPTGYECYIPYPANNKITVSYTLDADADAEICLSDVSGRVAIRVKLGKQCEGNHSYELDLSDLSGGLYFCRINADGQNGNIVKIIINH